MEAACPVGFLQSAACDYYIHDRPFVAAVAALYDSDIHNDLPFVGGAFAVLGEDRSFGTRTHCHRTAW